MDNRKFNALTKELQSICDKTIYIENKNKTLSTVLEILSLHLMKVKNIKASIDMISEIIKENELKISENHKEIENIKKLLGVDYEK